MAFSDGQTVDWRNVRLVEVKHVRRFFYMKQ
jgi:hypothetical protein